LTVSKSSLSHSFIIQLFNCSSVFGLCANTLLSRVFQIISIGFKSGDRTGQR
jgi:hypothetical protein